MQKIRDVLGNGFPYALSFFAISFALGYLVPGLSLKMVLAASVVIGVAAWLANGLLFSRFTKPVKKLQSIVLPNAFLHEVVLEAPANHLIDESMVSGKLFLTAESLIFVAHESYREGEKPAKYWTLSQLAPERFYPSFLNAGGVFLLTVNDASTLTFEVDKLKPWKQLLAANASGKTPAISPRL